MPKAESLKMLLVSLLTFFVGGALVWGLAVAYVFNYDRNDFIDFSLFAYVIFAPFVLPIPAVLSARLIKLQKKRHYMLLFLVALLTPYGAAPLYYTVFNGALDVPTPTWIEGEFSLLENTWLQRPQSRPWLYIDGLPSGIPRVTFYGGESVYVDYRHFRRGWIVSYKVDYHAPVSVFGTLKLFSPYHYELWAPTLSISEELSGTSMAQLGDMGVDKPFSSNWLALESCDVNKDVTTIVL